MRLGANLAESFPVLNSYFANRVDGRFAYGPAQGMPDDQPMDMAGLARVKRDWMSGDGLLTLGICSRNIGAMSIGGATRGTLTVEMAKRDWGGARALGLPITLHTSGASPIKLLEEPGLLGSDVQLVHPLLTTRRACDSEGPWRELCDSPRGQKKAPPETNSASTFSRCRLFAPSKTEIPCQS